jgi:hypothetical protein
VEGEGHWNAEELRRELARFERELRDAGLTDSSVRTYVGEVKSSSDGSTATTTQGDPASPAPAAVPVGSDLT